MFSPFRQLATPEAKSTVYRLHLVVYTVVITTPARVSGVMFLTRVYRPIYRTGKPTEQALLRSIELGSIKCNSETAKIRRNTWQL